MAGPSPPTTSSSSRSSRGSRTPACACRCSSTPIPDVARLAAEVGADRVEIYTGPYGGAFAPEAKARERDKVDRHRPGRRAAGIGLNAGHDLTLDNLPPLVAALPNLAEVSIGHALIADALIYGMAETIRRYRAACGNPVDA